jgi:hypothetical protein
MVVAERVSTLSEIVEAAGVTDVAEGLEMLEASEDVDLMGAMVGLMSADDLERGLELARMAGELWSVGNVVDLLEMPVLSAFLASRGIISINRGRLGARPRSIECQFTGSCFNQAGQ